MPKAGVSHDITIQTLSGTTYGFMLARSYYRRFSGGGAKAKRWGGPRRAYSIADSPTVQPLVPTREETTQAQFPSEIAMYFAQTNWQGGIGGDTSETDPLKIALATKADSSIYGKIRNARQVTTTTVDSNPADYKPTGFALVGTEVWAFIGRDVYSWNYGTASWNKQTQPVNAANIYRNGVEFSGNTVAPSWQASDDTPQRYIYKADADAQWTRIGAGAGTQIVGIKYLATGKNSAGGDILWGANVLRADATLGTNIIVSTTNPTSIVTWSSEVSIGDSAAPITGLVSDGNNLIILKTDGIWVYYADGSTENLTSDFEAMANPNNFRGAFNWNGHVLLPGGSTGLYELSNGKLFDISLSLSVPGDTTLAGKVVAIAGDPTSLFIMVEDTTNLKMHILMAKWLELDGVWNYRWHHMGSITYTTSDTPLHSAMLGEGVPSGSTLHHRIWAGVESTGSSLLPYFLPLDTDVADAFTNDNNGIWQLVKYDGGRPQVNKTFASIDIESANLGAAGRLFTVEFRVDAGSWLTTLTFTGGTVGGNTCDLSPNQTATFPAGTTGKVLEIRLKPAQTTANTTSPEFLSHRVTCTLRAPAEKMLPLTLHLGDGVMNLNGQSMGRPKLDLAQLTTWDAAASEVRVVDTQGTSRDMVFVSGRMHVQEISNEIGRRPEFLVSVLLAEV